MRYPTITYWKRICACILCAVLLMGNIMLPVHAESDPLKPADTVHENGNIVLHKQATRIAADEWEIDVQAKINDTPVEPPKLEVVFVLDASSTMNRCTDDYLPT